MELFPNLFFPYISREVSVNIFQNWEICFGKAAACQLILENSNNRISGSFIKIFVAGNQIINLCGKHPSAGGKLVVARIEIASSFNGHFTNNRGSSGNYIFDMNTSILRQCFCQSLI